MPYDYMGYDPETGLSEDGMSRDLLDRFPAVPYAGNPVMNMPDFSASPPAGGFGGVTTTRPAPVMPSPIPQELVEPPPLRLNIPETGEISPEHIAQFVGLAQNLHKQQRESQAAAIRYQGQLEYQQLINAGVPPDEAMRRTLPKIAYGHADTWTSTMQHTREIAERERAKAEYEKDRDERLKLDREWRQAQKDHFKALEDAAKDKTKSEPRTLGLPQRGELEEIEESLKKYNAIYAKAVEDKNMPEQNRAESVINGLRIRRRKLYDPTYGMPVPAPTTAVPAPALPVEQMAPPPLAVASNAVNEFRAIPTNAMTAPAMPAVPTARVRVKSPSGKIGNIPSTQLDQALKEGYVLLD